MKLITKRNACIAGVAAVVIAVGIGVGASGSLTNGASINAGLAAYKLGNIEGNALEAVSASLGNGNANEVAASQNAKSAYANMFIVTTDSEYVNVRAAADENAEVIAKAYNNCGGTVLDKGETWTYIQSGNAKGYINNQFLSFGDDVEKLATERCLFTAIVNNSEVRIRKEANTECDTWGLAYQGDSFQVTNILDEWVQINYNGDYGYLAKEFISFELNLGTAITLEEEAEMARLEQERLEAEAAAAAAEAAAYDNAIANAVGGCIATDREEYLLACLVQHEAGSEPYAGKLATANVVVTRVPMYGSIEAALTAPGQFTDIYSGYFARIVQEGPSSECIQAARDAIAGVDNRGYTNFCSGSYYLNHGVNASRGEMIGNQYFYCR